MLTENLPALIIILPMMAAPVCLIVHKTNAAWLIATTANLLTVIFSVQLFLQTSDGSVIHYELGSWAAPTDIEYYVDTLNAALLALVSFISLMALIYSLPTLKKEIAEERRYLYYTGWLLCLTGLLGILITGDAFNVFVFLEISSLSMYMLIALGRERKSALMAAFRYLILGSIGASFILIGIGFLYAATGTLNMVDLAERIPGANSSRTILVAFTFITLGLLIKAAVFPVYSWLPNAYQFAPSAVTAFLAGTATKVSIYVFLRFFFQVFNPEYSFGQLLLGYVLLPLSIVGFLLMSVVAVFQTDLRRMLAYSSIAQIGYIVASISMATQAGLTAGIIHIINHAFIKAALFMSVGCIIYSIGNARASSVGGLIRNMPWTTSGFIVAGISMIGVPLTAGFVSKWNIVSAAMDADWWPIAIMILVSSLLAIVYIGKTVEAFLFKPASSTLLSDEVREAPMMMLIPMWILIGISLFTGISGDTVVDIADASATLLLSGFVPIEAVQ